MRTRFTTYIAAISLLLITSCEDFLNEPISGIQILDNYFQTEEECKKFVAGCYRGIFQYGEWYGTQFFYVLTESATDDAWLSNPTQAQIDYKDFSQFRVTASNDYLYPFWEYMYKDIYQCNIAMGKLAESPVNQSNPALIQQLIAEVRFIRAYCYFELAKNFKEIPLLTRVYDANELLEFPLSDQATIFNQIITDMLALLRISLGDHPKVFE